jgi:hypothetical protein
MQASIMGMPVRIDDQLYEQAKAHAHAESPTITGQIEFWAMVGKTALDNPDLLINFVKDLLVARAEGGKLGNSRYSAGQRLMSGNTVQVLQPAAFSRPVHYHAVPVT